MTVFNVSKPGSSKSMWSTSHHHNHTHRTTHTESEHWHCLLLFERRVVAHVQCFATKGHVHLGKVSWEKMDRSGLVHQEACAAELACLWHPKSSSQEHKYDETVLHPEPAQRHRTCCWGEQLAEGMPQLIRNTFNLCLDKGPAEKKRISPGYQCISW